MTEEIKVIPTNGTSADNVKYAKRVEAIYIDGVDVSDCRLRQYNSDLCDGFKMDNSGFHQGHCRQNPNCYYKQLKRLEQENEELKIKLSSTKCYLCGEGFLTPEGAELYEEKESYRSALEEIKTILDKECGIISNAKVVGIINEVLK